MTAVELSIAVDKISMNFKAIIMEAYHCPLDWWPNSTLHFSSSIYFLAWCRWSDNLHEYILIMPVQLLKCLNYICVNFTAFNRNVLVAPVKHFLMHGQRISVLIYQKRNAYMWRDSHSIFFSFTEFNVDFPINFNIWKSRYSCICDSPKQSPKTYISATPTTARIY